MEKNNINYYETYKKKYPDVVKTTIDTLYPFSDEQAANLANYVAEQQKSAVVGIVKSKEIVNIYTSAQLAAEQSKVDSETDEAARRLMVVNVPEDEIHKLTEEMEALTNELKQIGKDLDENHRLYMLSDAIVKICSVWHRYNKLQSELQDKIEEYRKKKEASNEEEKI